MHEQICKNQRENRTGPNSCFEELWFEHRDVLPLCFLVWSWCHVPWRLTFNPTWSSEINRFPITNVLPLPMYTYYSRWMKRANIWFVTWQLKTSPCTHYLWYSILKLLQNVLGLGCQDPLILWQTSRGIVFTPKITWMVKAKMSNSPCSYVWVWVADCR